MVGIALKRRAKYYFPITVNIREALRATLLDEYTNESLSEFKGLILLLYTFFKDFKILKSYLYCFKRLLSYIDYLITRTMRYIF
ncbi:hypothetical protein N7507_005008 [Penicillium longicatenatum]|nr:hypothetical protein N7507_005008 [Penicillium longicatenatum]